MRARARAPGAARSTCPRPAASGARRDPARRDGRAPAAAARVLEHLAHQLARRAPGRARPTRRPAGRGRRPAPTGTSVVVDEVAVLLVHEVEVARVAGGDHRLAEATSPPPSSARSPRSGAARRSSRSEAIMRVALARARRSRRSRRCRGGRRSPRRSRAWLRGSRSWLIDLSDQRGRRRRARTPRLNASTGAERVLALEDAVVVEREEEREAVRASPSSPGSQRRRRASIDRHAHRARPGSVERGASASATKRDADPELVDVARTSSSKLLGEVASLPPPDADRVAVLEERPARPPSRSPAARRR